MPHKRNPKGRKPIPVNTNTERIDFMHCPCGCEFWNQGPNGEEFVIKPCDLECDVYRYALAQSMARGQPIEVRRES